MANELFVIIAMSAAIGVIVSYYILRRTVSDAAKKYETEIEDVLNAEEFKVKGRFE